MSAPEGDALLEAMDRVARSLAGGSVTSTQNELTTQAVAEIPGAQMASLSITHVDGHMDSVAASHPDAARCDELRDQLREGPCRDVATDHKAVAVGELAVDSRYPNYGPSAAALGMRSEVAVDVYIAGTSVMALNLYSREPDAFADSLPTAQLFAAQAAIALGFADYADDMAKSAATRGQIGQAIGLIMHRYSVNEARAFGYLTRLSQTHNVKLREVAAEIVKQHNDAHPD